MKDIKKVAKEYREKNGNEKITNKELLFYILARFDKYEKVNAAQDIKISVLSTRQKIMMWLVPVMIAGAAIIIGGI